MLAKIFDTQQNRRSAVSEVSSWLAQPTRDDGDMPLPPKRGSRSQPVVAQPARGKGDMPLPPKSGCRRSMQTGDMLQPQFSMQQNGIK